MVNSNVTRLGELVERFGGQLIGDANLVVQRIAPLEKADTTSITFLSNPKLRKQASQSLACAMIIKPADTEFIQSEFKGALILTDNPYAYFAKTAQLFVDQKKQLLTRVPGVHPSAIVHPTARISASAIIGPLVCIEADVVIGDNVQIDAGCFIGRSAQIGADSHFHANVTLHHACQIGQRAIIYSGAVVGGEGFGFANEAGKWIKIPQVGRVIIGNDVEIGANTCIDRGALDDTVIEDGVKLDNQIQIGHNCQIGAHTAIAGCVGIAGSTIIGKHCTIGGAASLGGHITIADGVHITGSSTVIKSIPKSGAYTGFFPLASHGDWERTAVLVRNIDSMREKMRAMEKTLQSLMAAQNTKQTTSDESKHD